MAAGLQASQGSAGRRRNWRLLDAATATNSPPSGASAGRALSDLPAADFGAYYESKSVGVLVYSTAGSGTMTVTIDMWGYDSVSGFWFNLGRLNAGSAIAETGTDVIRYAEVMDDLFDWDRLYPEVVAIGGTATAITIDLRVPFASRP